MPNTVCAQREHGKAKGKTLGRDTEQRATSVNLTAQTAVVLPSWVALAGVSTLH